MIDSSCEALDVIEVDVVEDRIINEERVIVQKKMLKLDEDSNMTLVKYFDCEDIVTEMELFECYQLRIIKKREIIRVETEKEVIKTEIIRDPF